MGRISLCPFPDESTDVYRICCQSVLPFGSFPGLKFPRLLNLWHPTPPPPPEIPPGVLRGDLYLAHVYFQMNPLTWTKVGANGPAFPDFWIDDPLKPPKCPLVSWGQFVWRISNPTWICHVCQTWCQSAQPFGSFSWICSKVQTSTSLTFFTANFVAFSGALAEVLMIFCRPACKDWIVYIDTMISYVHMPNRCEAPLLQMARRILSDLPEAGHPMATGRGDRLTTGKHRSALVAESLSGWTCGRGFGQQPGTPSLPRTSYWQEHMAPWWVRRGTTHPTCAASRWPGSPG